MNKNEIKEALDPIKPKAYMEERVQANLPTKRSLPKRRLTAAIAAVLLVPLIAFGTVRLQEIQRPPLAEPTTETPMVTTTQPTTTAPTTVPVLKRYTINANRVPGGLVIDTIQDNSAVSLPSNIKTPVCCRVQIVDLSNMSNDEAYAAYQEMDKEYWRLQDWFMSDEIKNALQEHISGQLYYGYPRDENGSYAPPEEGAQYLLLKHNLGTYRFDFTDEELAKLESIDISTENELTYMWYESTTRYYGIDYEPFVPDPTDPNADWPDTWYGYDEKPIHISGEEYRKDWQQKHLVKETGYWQSNCCYRWDIRLSSLLSDEPGYDITDFTDKVTFTVTFTDGSITESIVQINFDEDGWQILTPIAYQHLTAEEAAALGIE